jgi:hypothetical protein
VYTTFLAPYMFAIKSEKRRIGPPNPALGAIRNGLPGHHQVDFDDLVSFFALGGLRTRLTH